MAVPSPRLAESQLSAQFYVPERCFRTAQSRASPPRAGAEPLIPEHGPKFQKCSPGEPNAAATFVSREAKIQLQEFSLPGRPGSGLWNSGVGGNTAPVYLPRKDEVVEQTQEDGGPPSALRVPPLEPNPAGGAMDTSDAPSVK